MDETIERILDDLYETDARQRTRGLPSSQRYRNVEATTGRFLNLLARSIKARTVVEIGSSNGVSTIWLAEAMTSTGGFVVGTELLPERCDEANANLAAAGLASFAHIEPGPAAETLATIEGPLDFVFIDAEKEDYVDHFLAVVGKLRSGGVVLADNLISHDLSDYQEHVGSRSDVITLTIPIDRGLEFTVKR
jgi:predicted O-methyltransferase YrrM